MTATKFTKKDVFTQIKALLDGEKIEITKQELKAFCDHEIELLNKKKTGSKPSKNQQENVKIKETILDILKEIDRPATISEIQTTEPLNQFTNQRISALMTQLKKDGKVIRTEVKRKAYFSLADIED